MAARTSVSLRSLLLLRQQHVHRNVSLLHTPAAAAVYPPVVPSLTAKSKSSTRHRYELRVDELRASAGDEKLRLLTRVPRMKYVVFPQTQSRQADRWYRSFTKTAYIPGLPEPYHDLLTPGGDGDADAAAPGSPSPPPGVWEDTLAEVRSLVSVALLQEQWHLEKRKPFLYRVQEHSVEPFLRNLVAGLTGCLAQHNPLLLLATKGTD